MSYYLLLKLQSVNPRATSVWIYVVLPFAQTHSYDSIWRTGLNICRITFCSNWMDSGHNLVEFEYMSYYLLLKLRVWAKGFISTFLNYSSSSKSVSNPGCSSVVCCFLSMYFSESDHWLSVTQSTRTLPWGGSPAWIYFNAERPPDWVGVYLA